MNADSFLNGSHQRTAYLMVILFVILLVLPFSAQAQKSVKTIKSKSVAGKTKSAKVFDWRDAFPVLSGYRRTIQKPQIDTDGKLYFQMAKYERLNNKSDSFEISLHRFPSLKSQLSSNREMTQIKIAGYDANRVPRTCGLDFREYSLEIFPDDKTNIMNWNISRFDR